MNSKKAFFIIIIIMVYSIQWANSHFVLFTPQLKQSKINHISDYRRLLFQLIERLQNEPIEENRDPKKKMIIKFILELFAEEARILLTINYKKPVYWYLRQG